MWIWDFTYLSSLCVGAFGAAGLCFSLQNEHHLKPAVQKAPTHNELRYVQSQIHITKYTNKALITKQPMKNTTHKRTQWSQSIIDSGQNQLKYTYQLQQRDKTHHTKHTPLYTVNLH